MAAIGGNLPEVARSWGKTFAEFRRGLTGFQSELNTVIYSEPEKLAYHEDSSYANGYEERDAYQDDHQNDSQNGSPDDHQDEIDESQITVSDAGKETIVIDEEQEADKKTEAEPAD